MHIDSLDHMVLTVRDIAATCEFYEHVLGMRVVTFDAGRVALQFGSQKINLHEVGKEFEPKASNPTPGSAGLCFTTTFPWQRLIEHIKSCGVTIEERPVTRTGATGQIESIYIRDPDGNPIEVARYPRR